ncbi:MAG: type II toxin-antitoxin system HicB family antitoxin [Dorea sp.]|nr:type II toxin-antitoxin system HicB family antitoxin [Dorea sp.]
MIEQCIDNFLELCRKTGKNPDKEFKGSFNVRLAPELHRKAAIAAKKRRLTLNQYVTEAIYRSAEDETIA